MTTGQQFRLAMIGQLEAPFGGNLQQGLSAEALAREFRDGVPGLLDHLLHHEAESYPMSLCQLLLEVWQKPGDDLHILKSTGHTRDQWIALFSRTSP